MQYLKNTNKGSDALCYDYNEIDDVKKMTRFRPAVTYQAGRDTLKSGNRFYDKNYYDLLFGFILKKPDFNYRNYFYPRENI